jgi:hypothetical protein
VQIPCREYVSLGSLEFFDTKAFLRIGLKLVFVELVIFCICLLKFLKWCGGGGLVL